MSQTSDLQNNQLFNVFTRLYSTLDSYKIIKDSVDEEYIGKLKSVISNIVNFYNSDINLTYKNSVKSDSMVGELTTILGNGNNQQYSLIQELRSKNIFEDIRILYLKEISPLLDSEIIDKHKLLEELNNEHKDVNNKSRIDNSLSSECNRIVFNSVLFMVTFIFNLFHWWCSSDILLSNILIISLYKITLFIGLKMWLIFNLISLIRSISNYYSLKTVLDNIMNVSDSNIKDRMVETILCKITSSEVISQPDPYKLIQSITNKGAIK